MITLVNADARMTGFTSSSFHLKRPRIQHIHRTIHTHGTYGSHFELFMVGIGEEDTTLPRTKNSRDVDIPIARWTTKQLLNALDDRGIRYPPTASREDLEVLFWNGHEKPHYEASTGKVKSQTTAKRRSFEKALERDETTRSREVLLDHLQKRARRRRRQIDEPAVSLPQTFARQVPKVAGTLLDRAARKVKRFQRSAVDFFAIDDETGVRDVRYRYLNKQQRPESTPSVIVDVPSQNVEVIVMNVTDFVDDDSSFETATTTEVGPSSQPASGRLQMITFDARPKSYSQDQRRPASPNQTTQQRQRPGYDHRGRTSWSGEIPRRSPSYDDQPVKTSGKYLLPSSGNALPSSGNASDGTPDPSTRRSKRRLSAEARRSTPPRKRVYSPYGANPEIKNPGAEAEDDRDVVDRVVDFLADTADKFMWGKFDEQLGSKQWNASSSPSKPRSRPRHQRRHWKDRLEEQLDSVLGLHEDGGFYNKWAAREEKEKREENGNDAFSVAQGRQPKKERKALYDKPIWEEEGNLISLLFGRTRSGRNLLFDNRLGFESGSVLLLFRAALKSFLLVGSYLCRWASTQGALPQPVVVMGVTAAAVCSRPRQRMMAIVVTLLLLRTVGELLHGYAYGPEGWEDESDDESSLDNEDAL